MSECESVVSVCVCVCVCTRVCVYVCVCVSVCVCECVCTSKILIVTGHSPAGRGCLSFSIGGHRSLIHCKLFLEAYVFLYNLMFIGGTSERSNEKNSLLCGSLRRMLFLLACMVVKYGVLDYRRQAGSSLARCLRFICIF